MKPALPPLIRLRRSFAWLAALLLVSTLLPAGTAQGRQPDRADHLHRRPGAAGLQRPGLPLHRPRRGRLDLLHHEGVAGLVLRRHGQLDRPRLAAEPGHLQLGERQRVGRPGRLPQRQVLLVRAGDRTGRPAAMAIGVAVSDSPTGPFRDALGHPLVENGEIDPTVFIDDDGQAYLYWGNPNLWYVQAERRHDLLLRAARPRSRSPPRGSAPAPATPAAPRCTRKAPGSTSATACTTWCSRPKCCSEFIAYSTAPGPTGPWTYRGTIMPTQGGSFTNHPGVIDFNGGSYFFYHNGALPGGGGYTRSVAVEKFTYNADGTIPTINMTTDRRAAGRHAQPVRAPGGRDHRLGVRHRDRAVQRRRDERRLDRERRLHQGQGRRLRRRARPRSPPGWPRRTSGGRIELRLDSADRHARRHAAPCRAPAAGRPGRRSPAR